MKPLVYQMLPRLWGNVDGKNVRNGSLPENGSGRFAYVDGATLEHLRSLGVTHVWFTGVPRHATQASTDGCSPSDGSFVKGLAGSPYCITDWFAVNPYLGTLDEFRDLVERTHDAGLKVLIDFIPNHVSRDYGAFSPRPIVDGRDAAGHPVFGALDDSSVHWKPENDFYWYPGEELRLPVPGSWKEYPARASGNCFSSSPGEYDWYDTVRLNYCDFHTPTWDKMLEVVRFWAALGVDGMRCDMVELVPWQFCKWLISKVKEEFPGFVFVAEVYDKSGYSHYLREVGFDWLYDKSGLYDAMYDVVFRGGSAASLTRNWQSLGDLQEGMLGFLENHDEVRLASDFFAGSAERSFAAVYASMLFGRSPYMLYFGQEVGERGMDAEGFSGLNGRTSIFDWWCPAGLGRLWNSLHGLSCGLTSTESVVLDRYKELARLCSGDAVGKGGTWDLCYCAGVGFDPGRHFAFMRAHVNDVLLVVCNFSDTLCEAWINIPEDAGIYFGIDVRGLSRKVSVAPHDAVAISFFCETLRA